MAGTEAFFLAGAEGGQRLCLHHAPNGRARSAVIYVHPFGEEMNKSRRMAAMQSRLLAAHGHAVLQIDLMGCGDSSGDFGDASWAAWLADVAMAMHWMRERHQAPLWLWGLRAGALLAAAAAAAAPTVWPGLLFWQPAAQGKALLQQFLRLKAAAELQGGGARGVMEALRSSLEAGEPVDIAGYRLSPGLAAGLEQATLAPPAVSADADAGSRVEWLELSSREDAELSPASQAVAQRWQAAGWTVNTQIVAGPSFWQTTEIEDAPALLPATLAALERHIPA